MAPRTSVDTAIDRVLMLLEALRPYGVEVEPSCLEHSMSRIILSVNGFQHREIFYLCYGTGY